MRHHLSMAYLAPAITVLLLSLITVLMLTRHPAKSWAEPSGPRPTPITGQVVVDGEVVCLPHKDQSGPQTLECAFGLKDDSGQHYSLSQLDQQQLIDASIAVGRRYRVTGTVTRPSTDNQYAIVGAIAVGTIKPL